MIPNKVIIITLQLNISGVEERDDKDISISDEESERSKSSRSVTENEQEESDDDKKSSESVESESRDKEENSENESQEESEENTSEDEEPRTEQEKISEPDEGYLSQNDADEQRALELRVKVIKNITYELNDLEDYLKRKFRFYDLDKVEERISERFTRK